MRALVTGAAGFVGAVLARRLAKDGHEVHALVRPSSDLWRLEGAEARTPPLDLAEEPAVGDVVGRVRPEWIFHLAAHGAYPSQSDFRAMVRTNVLGTIHLVESCLRIGFDALVNTGSSSEYGFTDHAPSEDEEPRPSTDYAVTKLTATLYCRAAAARSGHSIPTLRLYSVYGPHEEPSRFVPQLAVRGLEGKLPPLVSPDVARGGGAPPPRPLDRFRTPMGHDAESRLGYLGLDRQPEEDRTRARLEAADDVRGGVLSIRPPAIGETRPTPGLSRPRGLEPVPLAAEPPV